MQDPPARVAVMTLGAHAEAPDPDFIVTCLREAGAVVARTARIDRFVPLVRRQLAAWVADPTVDVIVVLGAMDDEIAAAAIAPLVTEPLGGLPEAKADAMRCHSTIVFFLHSSAETQRLAFDELIALALSGRAAGVVAAPAAVEPTEPVMELDELEAEELATSAPDLAAVPVAAAPVVAPPVPAPAPSVPRPPILPPAAAPGAPPPAAAAARAPAEAPLGAAAFATRRAGIGLAPKLLAAVAVAAVAAVVVVFVVTRPSEPAPTVVADREPPPPAPPPPPPVPDPAVVPPVPIDAAGPDAPVIDVEPPSPPDAARTPPPPRPSHLGATPPPPHTHDSPPPPAPAPDAAVEAPPPPVAADGCDEVSCVLDHYAHPCCEQFKPKAPPRAPDGEPQTLDKVAVREAIEPVKPVVIACGEKANVKGIVKIALDVSPDGAVTSASVSASPTPELGACVATALRRAHFPKTQGGASFVYPFVF